ncbi:MAG: methyltransferase domain-containing protein [Actinomycetota bacterium]|nr:methyltransferase domain-containing protein [Actinomycetota bacterium]MDP3631189.1 methyltransferase domain-containing protein [Actinomycetota bacterium]
MRAFTQANRAVWEASAPLHGAGDGWDDLLLAAGNQGFSVLDDCLTATLTALDVSGRTAVQVGCNNARELLSLASLGAIPALGIDQSAAFLAQAAQLADAAGLSPRLLEADIYDLPEDVGRFDLVLITIGVLNWMPDLERFFRVVRGLMNPGALLVIYETHPILDMFDPQSATPLVPCTSYFDKAPIEVDDLITYDGTDGGKGETGYWFVQTLGEIVTACVSSDMALQRLEEHPHSNREVEYSIYENQVAQLPLCYTLVARATA